MRVYDPTLGRFLSRDPLNRAPLFITDDNPYVYAGNNPLSNVDPSGQKVAGASAAQVKQAAKKQASAARVQATSGCSSSCKKAKAVAALTAYYRHLAVLIVAITATVSAGILLVPVVIDIFSIVAVPGNLGAWANLLVDGLQLGSAIATAVLAWKEYDGQDIAALDGWTQVLNGLTVAATVIEALGTIAFIFDGIGEVINAGLKKIMEFLEPQLTRLVLNLVAGNSAIAGLSLYSVNQRIAELSGLSLPQLEQKCSQAGIGCS